MTDRNTKKPPRPPDIWGTSSAAFYAELEGEAIDVELITGAQLTGLLSGVDRYDLFLEQADGNEVLVAKGAIAFAQRAAKE
jgi:sRNA-binding regulator protein Hfq